MMLRPPWSDVLFVSFAVAILLFIVRMVFKRDRSADPEPLVPKDYEKLPLVNKIRVLTNKLIDVQRNGLGRNKTAVAEMRDRSAEIQRIRSVGELQYREVLLQCALVIEWLEESDEYRKRYMYYMDRRGSTWWSGELGGRPFLVSERGESVLILTTS